VGSAYAHHMSLGLLIPLILLIMGVVEAFVFRQMSQRGVLGDSVANGLIVVSLIFPLVAYGVLNFALPEIGAITIL